MYRTYRDRPSYLATEPVDDIFQPSAPRASDTHRSTISPSFPFQEPSTGSQNTNLYAPFDNATTFLLVDWMNRGVKEKTHEEMDRLVHSVIRHPDFRYEDLASFSSKVENDRLDRSRSKMKARSDWKEGSVELKLPSEATKQKKKEALAPSVVVSNIQYRSILDTIYAALDDDNSPIVHFEPYKQYWKHGNSTERLYGELYSGDAWIKAHEEVRSKPKAPDDTLDNFVVPIMLYSDSTHLTSFGTASLWPIYMFLGGQSKYMRARSTEGICHHLAYVPSVSLSFVPYANFTYSFTIVSSRHLFTMNISRYTANRYLRDF